MQRTSHGNIFVSKEEGKKMINTEWVICPICKNKTRNKIRQDTILKNYPLFCPKCKNETLIDIEDMKVRVIKE